jgi:hypothetical protein
LSDRWDDIAHERNDLKTEVKRLSERCEHLEEALHRIMVGGRLPTAISHELRAGCLKAVSDIAREVL